MTHDIFACLSRCGTRPGLIRITDVGAMASGASDQWSGLIDPGWAELLGFEPQEEECARCNELAGGGRRYLPVALGDGHDRSFHRCRFAQTSSFYKPNIDVISRYHGLPEQMDVLTSEPISTKRLDDIDQARHTDLLKLDVQGAELDVLAHGTETLKHVGIVQIEVSFLQLYEGQPLFADIDTFLRQEGFALHTFLGFGTRPSLPFSPADMPPIRPRQTLWSDAVYLKADLDAQPEMDPGGLLKRAALLHELYQSYDFAARDLLHYDRLTGEHTVEAYASMLHGRRAA